MARFSLKFILFLLPISLIFAFPVLVFWLGREYLSVDDVIARQAKDPSVLFGPALVLQNYFEAYKRDATALRDPAVIALGSSRVLELTDSFFKEPSDFYNDGKGAAAPSDLLPFLTSLTTDARPKVILLGIDPSYVTPNAPVTETYGTTPGPLELFHDFLTFGWREAYHQYFLGNFTFAALVRDRASSPDIGLSALINGNGFRADGSYAYTKLESDPNHASVLASQIKDDVSGIEAGSGFEYGDSLDETKLVELDAFLKEAQAEHVDVIGFMTPVASEVSAALDARDDAASASRAEATKTLSALFTSDGAKYYDLERLSTFGSSDAELIDPTHTTETGSLKLLIYLAQRDASLQEYVSLPALEHAAATATSFSPAL